jgi:hypothetical protein
VSLRSTPTFGFGRDLPLEPVDGGTNVLVTGPESAGLKDLVHAMLDPDRGEGLVAVSTSESGRSFRRAQERTSSRIDDDYIGIVECEGSITSDECVTSVSGPDDLTGIDMQLSSLSDELSYGDVEGVRHGLYSVSPLVAAADDMRDVYRFLQNTISRNRRSDGLFVCGIDPDADCGEMGEATSIASGISTAFHGTVELRDSPTDPEIRTDVDGQPDGWQSVRL